jgi:hypothetical protein
MNVQGKLGFKGTYTFEHWRGDRLLDRWEDSNLIPTEGLNSMLGVGVHADAQITAWYMGIGSGNYTVDPTDTGANIVARVTEITAYTGNRQQVVFAAPAAGSTDNSASKVTFTFNNTVATVTNAFVNSAATGNGGKLLSSLKLGTAKTGFATGDQLVVTFTLTAASV